MTAPRACGSRRLPHAWSHRRPGRVALMPHDNLASCQEVAIQRRRSPRLYGTPARRASAWRRSTEAIAGRDQLRVRAELRSLVDAAEPRHARQADRTVCSDTCRTLGQGRRVNMTAYQFRVRLDREPDETETEALGSACDDAGLSCG